MPSDLRMVYPPEAHVMVQLLQDVRLVSGNATVPGFVQAGVFSGLYASRASELRDEQGAVISTTTHEFVLPAYCPVQNGNNLLNLGSGERFKVIRVLTPPGRKMVLAQQVKAL